MTRPTCDIFEGYFLIIRAVSGATDFMALSLLRGASSGFLSPTGLHEEKKALVYFMAKLFIFCGSNFGKQDIVYIFYGHDYIAHFMNMTSSILRKYA